MSNAPKGAHMETATVQSEHVEAATKAASFVPLDRETRAGVDTDCAAFHLNREPQTLRIWACKESGPIRPRRVNGRLMWATADLRKLCGV